MKKGFTLMELMGVLVIIGLLAVLITPTISKTLKKYTNKTYDYALENIVQSAKNWGVDNKGKLPTSTIGDVQIYPELDLETYDYNKLNIRLSSLQEEGYIDSTISNPKGGTFCNKAYITITKTESRMVYEITEAEEATLNLDETDCRKLDD